MGCSDSSAAGEASQAPAPAGKKVAGSAGTKVVGGDRPCIHIVWKVPAEEEATMDAFWKEHEEWMRSGHTMGEEGDDSTNPRLLHFHIAKGPEMKDPLAPEPEPTGNLLYVMSESYVAASGIAKHMELGNKEKAEWFGKMMEYNGKYGHHMDMGSTTVYTALEDTQPASIYQAGDPCIHLVMSVPAEEEKTLDAFWKEHETWMRKSHVMTRDGDDSVKPRLTSFNIRKGPEMKDPLSATPEPTGNILFIMSETYTDGAGIGKHMELAGKDMPEMMPKLIEYMGKYGKHMDIGSTKIFTLLDK